MINRNNYTAIEEFLTYLRKTKKCQQNTIDLYRDIFQLFLRWAQNTPFSKAMKIKQSFPDYLYELRHDGKEYSYSYQKKACDLAQRFYVRAMLKNNEEYGKIDPEWVEGIIPHPESEKDDDYEYYELEEIEKIAAVKPESIVDQRTIAAIILLFLSGMRIAAFLSVPISCVDIQKCQIHQFPGNGVYTKMRAARTTKIFRIAKLIAILDEWDKLVRSSCPGNSTWYARLDSNGCFNPKIVKKVDYMDNRIYKDVRSSYGELLLQMKKICEKAGVEYKSPHKARSGNIHMGFKVVKNLEDMKLIAANVLHKQYATTDKIYGRMNAKKADEAIDKFDFENLTANKTGEKTEENEISVVMTKKEYDAFNALMKLKES